MAVKYMYWDIQVKNITTMSHSEIKHLFHRLTSQYQLRCIKKISLTSDDKKQAPFWNILLTQTKN